ncbi:MAG: citrate synthase [Bacteroidota bacterium]
MDTNSFMANLEESVKKACVIDKEYYEKFDVKRGLRNKDKTGVLAGLTNVGDVVGYKKEGDRVLPVPGRLLYRGIEIEDLANGFKGDNRHGFDETVFLLLTGKLPSREELLIFTEHMAQLRKLPDSFIKNMILSMKGRDVLNMLARSILGLYTLDSRAEDLSVHNMIEQTLNIIAKFPTIIAYAYQAMSHAYQGKTLSIRYPDPNMSTAENFLYLVKGGNGRYSKLEADLLDLALVLHAEHGGGNNSTFTMRVTSSSETDIYSSITSAIGSLKGPLHGGANIKVLEMMEDMKRNLTDWKDEAEVKEYIIKILNKKVNDYSGKIYGIGHAVYTVSDPRAILLRERARDLAIEKGKIEEFELYELVEKLAPNTFAEYKGNGPDQQTCINVDFYSGFVYSCIGVPKELFTPLFAMARVAGWCTHRIEELTFSAKRIIRPSYKNVYPNQEYIPIMERL